MYHFFLHLLISDITSVHHTALSTKVEFDKASQINMQRQKLNNYKKKDRPFKNKHKHFICGSLVLCSPNLSSSRRK